MNYVDSTDFGQEELRKIRSSKDIDRIHDQIKFLENEESKIKSEIKKYRDLLYMAIHSEK